MRVASASRISSITAAALLLASLAGVTTGCGGAEPPTPAGQTGAPAAAADAPLPPLAFESQLPEGLRALILKPFTGDLDEMVARRMVRVGVTYNRTFYFVDGGVQRGAAAEHGRLFEGELNKKLKTKAASKIHVVFVPLPRTLLGQALTEGKVDLVMAQVTIRPELQALADFTNPTRTNVNEIVVTGPGAPVLTSADDLSGRDVYARKDSKYYESLVALNAKLEANGKAPAVIRDIPGNLEDDDVLELVNAGIIPVTVVDDYLATFWQKVFTDITVHDAFPLRAGASLAVPIRKGSPKLKAELNGFIATFGLGTAFGEMIEKRYLVSATYAKRATSDKGRRKYSDLAGLFRKYGDQYKMDYLLMAAQGFQESELDQNARSRVGAIGVMQVMPATGADMKVGDITRVEANIHAGVKYMRFVIDQYYKDEPMDALNKGLFAFASYNAGPGRIRQLRREAEKRGLDPNIWFGNVEQIASERIGRETVTYVSNIYKYYVAYRLLVEEHDRRDAAKAALKEAAK